MRRSALVRAPIVLLATLSVAACATTTNDEPVDAADPTDSLSDAELTGGAGRELAADDTSPLATGVIVDSDVPVTTVPIEGSAADLLPEISIEMSRLSSEIADDGDEEATIARIEASWEAIRGEVEASRPELVNGIQATIDMARTAVDANRPADADKAFGLLTDLIDAFVGDD